MNSCGAEEKTPGTGRRAVNAISKSDESCISNPEIRNLKLDVSDPLPPSIDARGHEARGIAIPNVQFAISDFGI